MPFVLLMLSFWNPLAENDARIMKHNGSEVRTTINIDEKFLGIYQGAKEGFLELNYDGTGIYRYDYAGLTSSCPGSLINIEWGFLLNQEGEIVRLERSYGYSYPIIYNASGENAFQDCSKTTMVDFILVYKDGTITISSSDDWVKK